jgi:slit protein 2
VNGYRCECPPLYGGRFCHQRLQFCSNGLNPCQNNAKCYPVEDNDYKYIKE